MKKLGMLLVLCLCLTYTTSAMNYDDPDKLIGFWQTGDGQSMVRIEKVDDTYVGKIVRLAESTDSNGNPRTDVNNPDDSLRDRRLRGSIVLNNFVYDAEDQQWVNGSLYDPDSGNTYQAKISLQEGDGNTIEIRGYVGRPSNGRVFVWTRIQRGG